MQEAWVQFLVGALRSLMPQGTAYVTSRLFVILGPQGHAPEGRPRCASHRFVKTPGRGEGMRPGHTQEPLKRVAPGSLALSCKVEKTPAQHTINTARPASSCSAGPPLPSWLLRLHTLQRQGQPSLAITHHSLGPRSRAGLALSVGSFTNQHPCPQSQGAEKTLRPDVGFPGQEPFSPDRWERSAGLGRWRWSFIPGPGL